jgi:hypothetical protein
MPGQRRNSCRCPPDNGRLFMCKNEYTNGLCLVGNNEAVLPKTKQGCQTLKLKIMEKSISRLDSS